jgi:prephenate dehydrogenase
MNILIIGGTGEFGGFYAKKFKEDGFEVAISGRNESETKIFCEKNGFIFSNNPEDFDIVVVSVPNSVAPKIVREIIPKLKKNALFIDFCSVKTVVVAEEEKFIDNNINEGIEIVSIHPMHGPRVSSISGYPIVMIPIKRGQKFEQIKSFFEKNGGKIIETTAESHDKTLSIVQGLTHYSQFVSAAVLREMKIDIKETMKFSSPNYSLFLSLLSRVVLQNPELYCQIQLENPYNEELRKIFTKNAKGLESICNEKQSDLLKKEIILDSQSFKDPELMLVESDRAVNSMKYILNTLREHIGKKFLIENIITKNFHYGVLVRANVDEIVLNEGKKEVKIVTSKVRLTTKEEMNEWKEKNIGKKSLDFSFLVPLNSEEQIIKNAFSSIKEAKFEIIDTYSGKNLPEKTKSITLRSHFFDDDDSEKISLNILKTINGLGFKVR